MKNKMQTTKMKKKTYLCTEIDLQKQIDEMKSNQ